MKNKTTAALLALFLGSLGIHRFYLNDGGRGIIYLLFCFTGIPLIIGIIDCIIFLAMSEEEFNRKYNRPYIAAQQAPAANAMNTVAINMGGTNQTSNSISDEIKKLYELKEKGIITQEEFELKKKTIL